MAIGPVQMLVVGFDGPKFKGEILEEPSGSRTRTSFG